MSISLQKGQKVSLSKEHSGLSKVLVGLGWDEVKRSKGFFKAKPQAVDCDASILLLQDGKLGRKEDIVYYGNLRHDSGTVQHMGDNLTGAGDGDDEQIVVDLARIPQSYDRLVVVVNIYQPIQRSQHFGLIENAFCRIENEGNHVEICKFNLTENYADMTALIVGEIYRHDGEWKFNAIGQGTNDPGLGELIKRYS